MPGPVTVSIRIGFRERKRGGANGNLDRQRQLPRLALSRLPKLVMDFGVYAFEAVTRVDAASRVQHGMGPEDYPFIPLLSGEPDTLAHQCVVDASPACEGFDMQQPKPGETVTLVRKEDRTSHGDD